MAKVITDKARVQKLLDRAVTQVIEREHLEKALLSGKRLRVKLGFDPTGSKIHIGRAIVLRKLKEFQDLGHKVIFIVGDFTAQIGDPSDKLEKRPMLSAGQIKENIKTYKKQVGKIVDLSKAEFKFNSKWLKKIKLSEFMGLQESFSVGQMLARRNFKERFEKGGEISIREFSYPLLQGYDSVEVRADVEIGGFDQLFNLQAGRTIQSHYGQEPQDILTTEMMEGTDGRKMSTSWGNVINIVDEPRDMFGKVMSIKDELIDKYFKLCTDVPDEEMEKISQNPKERKMRLAAEIVALYHGEASAQRAKQEFIDVFSKGRMPAEIPKIEIADRAMTLLDLVVASQLVASRSEARRLIEQGGVKVNEMKKTDATETIAIDNETVLQVGPRRFARIVRK